MIQQLLNGIITGSLYALIAVGLTMVYGILRILHIAHAAVFVSGAYLGLLTYTYTQSLIVALLAAAAGCSVLGYLIQRYLYTPMLAEERIVPLIASVGLFIFCEDLFRLLGGPYIRAFKVDLWFEKVSFFQAIVTSHQVLILIATAACLIAVYAIITHTKLGLAWQATAQDMDTACAMGVNIRQVVTFNFIIASSIAAVAGVMTAINYNSVLPTMGSVISYKMFAIVVLGGMGSIPGTILAGLIIGMSETFMSAYFGFIMPRDAIAFTAMILILIVRPQGLFGKAR
ncbi:MAG: branched-chain amino acid ABC transporter permease [Desulfobacterales bacterium]